MTNLLHIAKVCTHNFELIPDFVFYWYGDCTRMQEFGICTNLEQTMATNSHVYKYCFVYAKEVKFLGIDLWINSYSK